MVFNTSTQALTLVKQGAIENTSVLLMDASLPCCSEGDDDAGGRGSVSMLTERT